MTTLSSVFELSTGFSRVICTVSVMLFVTVVVSFTVLTSFTVVTFTGVDLVVFDLVVVLVVDDLVGFVDVDFDFALVDDLLDFVPTIFRTPPQRLNPPAVEVEVVAIVVEVEEVVCVDCVREILELVFTPTFPEPRLRY